jgi:hypothetical protein
MTSFPCFGALGIVATHAGRIHGGGRFTGDVRYGAGGGRTRERPTGRDAG